MLSFQGRLQNHTRQLPSLPLVSLPLRPSTLAVLIGSGFATTGDVMRSRLKMSSTSAASSTVDGENNNAKNTSQNQHVKIDNFAQELGCAKSEALDYAYEIDDALHSVGLLPAKALDNGESISSDHQTTRSELSPASPPLSSCPTSASSILRTNTPTASSRITTRCIVSFSQSFDILLGGGVPLSELTEIVGLPGSGKTQLAMQLCVDTRLPASNGGVEGASVVIDTEGSWSNSCCVGDGKGRLYDMAQGLVDHAFSSAKRRLDARRLRHRDGRPIKYSDEDVAAMVPSWFSAESILDGIHIFRVHDEPAQTCTLYNLPQFLMDQEEKGLPVKLIVIDSLAFHYRVSNSSSKTSGDAKKKNSETSTTHNLTSVAAFLSELAAAFDLAVVVLNQLTNKLSTSDVTTEQGKKFAPSLGEAWSHSVTSRILIERRSSDSQTSIILPHLNDLCLCTLLKSPHKPPGTCWFRITDKGIRGVAPHLIQGQVQQMNKRARTT